MGKLAAGSGRYPYVSLQRKRAPGKPRLESWKHNHSIPVPSNMGFMQRPPLLTLETNAEPCPYAFISFVYELLTASHTASVTSFVLALPPRSLVTIPLAQTSSTQVINLSAASF